MKILVINPGSTSTKMAIFDDDKQVWTAGAHHPVGELARFEHVADQYEYRRDFVIGRLEKADIPLRFDAVIGRGGLLHPLRGGVYTVNERMKHDLRHATMEHACNLGALIAAELAERCGCPAYTADPVVVDEMRPEARISGLPCLERRSVFHALNQKAVSRRYAASIGRRYEDLRLIVAHMGGGISVGAHCLGRVIDVNNALGGEGPFTPERCGTLPAMQLVELCYSGKYTLRQMKRMICGKGGLAGQQRHDWPLGPRRGRRGALCHCGGGYDVYRGQGDRLDVCSAGRQGRRHHRHRRHSPRHLLRRPPAPAGGIHGSGGGDARRERDAVAGLQRPGRLAR